MRLWMVKAKLHRARVTQCRMEYEGSVSIDRRIMEAVGILPWEVVQITNYANGTLWRTYAIAAAAGSGTIGLNGPPVRLFQPGDDVTILGFAMVTAREAGKLTPKVAFLDPAGPNRLIRVVTHRVSESFDDAVEENASAGD